MALIGEGGGHGSDMGKMLVLERLSITGTMALFILPNVKLSKVNTAICHMYPI